MTRWRSAGIGVATLPLLMLSARAIEMPRAAVTSYIVTDLGTFGTIQSAHANEVNNAGQVVGVAASRAFIWENGVKTQLPTLGGAAGIAHALNEAGQVVGFSTMVSAGPSRAVLWSNGGITNLTPDIPATETSWASGINESGQIAGNIGYATAFLWQNGQRTHLGHLGGGGSSAADINDSGVIVGASYTSEVTPMGLMQHPFKWQNGVMTNLGLLPGDEDAGAAAINSAGDIVGASGRTDPDTYETFYRAFLYSNGVMTAIPVPSTDAHAGDINESGVVVGTMRAAGGFSRWHGWVYADGQVTNLNHLIPQGGPLHIAFAYAINDDGQIAATAYDAQGHYHAVLLTPSGSAPPAPAATIFDTAVTEGNNGTRTVSFYVQLSFASTTDVTLAYSTANGTATAGTDYTATSGTLTIPAGHTIRTIDVTVRGDRQREPDEVFYVNVSNPSGATLVNNRGTGTLRNDDR